MIQKMIDASVSVNTDKNIFLKIDIFFTKLYVNIIYFQKVKQTQQGKPHCVFIPSLGRTEKQLQVSTIW